MHSLLERQLRRAKFHDDTLPADLAAWQEFLSRIERSYINADRERQCFKVSTTQPIKPPSGPLPLSKVVAELSDGLCLFDTQGQLIFFNLAAEKYLGLGSEQHNSKSTDVLDWFELHDNSNPDERLATPSLIQRLVRGDSFHDSYAVLQRADLPDLPVSCAFNPIVENQQVIGIVLLFRDISEVKNFETELITAKESAEKASSAKSQFLSSMSHELRTPMNAILGYSELLKEDLGVSLEEFELEHVEDMQQYVGHILHAGWHLLELINQVLDLTRIEAGSLDVTIEKAEVIELIKEGVNFVTPQAEKHAITIENTTDELPPQYALIDQGRLKQVIINLLSNAVKYNREGGHVSLHLTQPDPKYLRIEIKDTGVGMTPEQQSKVFDPFTRLSGLNLIEGTGIGLTITKRLLEIMDGRIGVESEIEVGSTFWIELPTGEIDHEGVDETATREQKYILLYIEDSRTNVSLVGQILKARPLVALMSAHTGEMGLELAHKHHPQIILLDINLPGMDGFEVLKHLRETADTREIPVLGLSANDTLQNLDRAREAGFFKYIVKPLDIKQFLKSVDEALGNN